MILVCLVGAGELEGGVEGGVDEEMGILLAEIR